MPARTAPVPRACRTSRRRPPSARPRRALTQACSARVDSLQPVEATVGDQSWRLRFLRITRCRHGERDRAAVAAGALQQLRFDRPGARRTARLAEPGAQGFERHGGKGEDGAVALQGELGLGAEALGGRAQRLGCLRRRHRRSGAQRLALDRGQLHLLPLQVEAVELDRRLLQGARAGCTSDEPDRRTASARAMATISWRSRGARERQNWPACWRGSASRAAGRLSVLMRRPPLRARVRMSRPSLASTRKPAGRRA